MRLFLDRDLGTRLGNSLRLLGVEVQLYADRYQDPMVRDERWISEVSADGWIILTHNESIRSHPAEREVFEAVGARGIVFATKAPTPFTHMRALMIAWARLNQIIEECRGPYLWGIDANGGMLRYVPVRGPSDVRGSGIGPFSFDPCA